MIVWINGAFGSGKTQTAFEINRRLENSYVYDPENIGYFFRRNMPKEIIQGNFQDQELWRTFNYEIIKNIYSKYAGHIIIPMTIYDKNYYEEIIGKLLKENIRIDHYILGASKATVLKRLSKRFEKKDSWAAKQIDLCIRGFETLKEKSVYIDTDELGINEVTEIIAGKSGIKLREDRDMEVIRKIKRAAIQIRHIRLFI
jgi:hypothetical protein